MTASCWALLEIEATSDEGVIRKAYARRLRDFRPDEDPVGFQRLVEARTSAITQAKWQRMRDEDTADTSQDEHYNDFYVSSDVNVLVADEDVVEPGTLRAVPQQRTDYSPLFRQPTGEVIDRTADAEKLFESLEQLLAECRKKRTRLQEDAMWSASPWTELFDRAASELALASHDAFIVAVARGITGLFPPYKTNELDRLDGYCAGQGIAAVVNAIECSARFCERGDFLFRVCDIRSAQIYFEWADIARQGNDILHRSAVGREAYFKGKIPVFPIGEQPGDVEDVDLGRYHERALEDGRWPWIFNPLRAVSTAYTVTRYVDRKIGLSLLVLSVMAASLPFVSQTSNYLLAGITSLLLVVALRIFLGFRSEEILVNRLIHNVIDVDRKKIWNKEKRSVGISLRIPYRLSGLGAFVSTIEVGALFITLFFGGIQVAWIWEVRHLYANPTEQIIADTFVSTLEGPAKGFGLDYSRFFGFLSRIQSDHPDGVPLRSLGVNTTAGALQNKLWLPKLFVTHQGVLTQVKISPIELYQRQNKAHLLSTKLWWNEQRDEKLRVLSLLYRAGDSALRVSIEEMLLLFSALINQPNSDESASRQQLLWKVMPPQHHSSLSVADEEMFQAVVLEHFVKQVGTRVSKVSEREIFSQFYWLMNQQSSELLASLALRKYSPLSISSTKVQSLEYGNLPSDRLLKKLLKGWQNEASGQIVFPNQRQASFQKFPPSEIIKFPDIDASVARRAFFEIASSMLSKTSPQLGREHLLIAMGQVPLQLRPSDADFWTTATVNLLRAIAGSAEPGYPMRIYVRNDSEEVEILVQQLIAQGL